MYLLIIFLPFLGAIFSGFRGSSLGAKGSILVSTISIWTTIFIALIAFYEVGFSRSPVSINLGCWISSEFLKINFNFFFDDLTISILLAVLIVSSLVHIYSISYISEDPHIQRFISYLSFFTASIVILVTGDSLLVIFIGWELIGVASFLLIGFWITRVQAIKSAIKAIIVNRIGDTVLSIGFFSIFIIFGNFDYFSIFSIVSFINEDLITIVGILLFGGAISKSAQLPLHAWLPDAIEGPTPVSALIHAATLVTAGVYLILRISPILEFGSTSLIFIAWVGSLTAFFAATTGLLQNDLKRVIAFSTCSQLGYIFLSLGLSNFSAALFHLVTHAFFKAGLFLAAGAIIHGIADQQDLRKLGGIITFLPFTYVIILICSLSLIAIPYLTGFFSKDKILELLNGKFFFSGYFAYFLGTFSAGITAFYSTRLILLTFFLEPNNLKKNYINVHEATYLMILPIIILAILAIFFGFLFSDIFLGAGTDFLSTVFLNLNKNNIFIESENLSLIFKILPIIFSFLGIFISLLVYNNFFEFFTVLVFKNKFIYNIYQFLNAKWNFDSILNYFFIYKFLNYGNIISKIIDRGIVEKLSAFGISNIINNFSFKLNKINNGIITTYSVYIIISVVLSLLLIFSPLNFNSKLGILFLIGLYII